MGSNNVIQFPGQGDGRKNADKESLSPTIKVLNASSVLEHASRNKNLVIILILALSLFTFNLKFSSSDVNSANLASLSQGRGLASVQSVSKDDLSAQLNFARQLASMELQESGSSSVGRKPSSYDQVRHGVLANKGYIFKRDLENGNLVSIQLQADENNPAYMLDPESFIEEYGDWLNSDFLSVEPDPAGEQIIGERRLSRYILETRSGRKFKVVIERDLFQRLTLLSQTEVAENSFN